MIVAHLTTVHPRTDVRILLKECASLANSLTAPVYLLVADGLGDAPGPGDITIVDVGTLPGSRMGRALLGSLRMLRAVRRIRADLVHFHDPELIPVGVMLRALGCRVVYDVHEDLPRQIDSKYWLPVAIRRPVSWAVSVVEWMAARAFTAIVAATPTIAARFPARRTITVRNYPMVAEFPRVPDMEYGLRPPGFAYVGGITITRGIREMIDAIDIVDPCVQATLELAGRFGPPSLERELAGTRGWRHVQVHGELGREQVVKLLGRARAGLVVLHPERNYVDAYPIKLFEYMAASLPVIASDFQLWREIVGGAGCGLLVDPLDTAAIAEAMEWMLRHPEQAEHMGRAGREAIERRYSWAPEAQRLIDLYRRIAS